MPDPKMWSWRWAEDVFISSDKLMHAVGTGYLYGILLSALGGSLGFFLTVAAGFLWEVKDALVPKELKGQWGGDGFSYKDFIMDLAGIGGYYFFPWLLKTILGVA